MENICDGFPKKRDIPFKPPLTVQDNHTKSGTECRQQTTLNDNTQLHQTADTQSNSNTIQKPYTEIHGQLTRLAQT